MIFKKNSNTYLAQIARQEFLQNYLVLDILMKYYILYKKSAVKLSHLILQQQLGHKNLCIYLVYIVYKYQNIGQIVQWKLASSMHFAYRYKILNANRKYVPT